MEQRSIASTRLAAALLVGIFAVQIYQAATRPVGTQEAYIYDRFVRPTTRQVWAQEVPDRDFLYALLEKRSVGLFHVSPFSIRLPGLPFLALYLWAVWNIAGLFARSNAAALAAAVLLGVPALLGNWFVTATGFGAALALDLCGIQFAARYLFRNQDIKLYYLNLAGVCFGLAIAARIDFAVPSMALAFLILAIQRDWKEWTERVLIPCLVVSLIVLVLPLSHAHAAETISDLPPSQNAAAQSGLRILRTRVGSAPISIGASQSVEPIVNFNKAQYRSVTWQRGEPHPDSGNYDYYLLEGPDRDLIERLHLIVLFEDAGIVLAQRSHAAL